MQDRDDEDQRVSVSTLVLIALFIIVLCGVVIWAPWSELEQTISLSATAAASR